MSLDRILHYRVLERIGHGGMGEIYTARDEHLHRVVVLKLIQAQRLDDTARRWFMREARAAAALSHRSSARSTKCSSTTGSGDLAVKHRQEFGHYHHAQYDVACALALLGEGDQAVAWLEQAAGNGLPCAAAFEHDAWLRPVRGLPRFAALLDRVRAERARYARIFQEAMAGSGV